MPYATRDDLRLSEELLTWLTTDGPDNLGLPDEAVIADALAAADNRINAHARQRYSLPLADPDQLLKDLAVKLARHWLYSRKPDGPAIPSTIADEKAAAEAELRDIRDGRLSLAESTSDPAPASEPGRLEVRAQERVFSADLLSKY